MNLRKKNEQEMALLRESYRKVRSEEPKKHKPVVMVKDPRTGRVITKAEYQENLKPKVIEFK